MTASRAADRQGASPPFRRGDVVLVPFPFADRLAEKQRPAVVVSSDHYQADMGDLILAQLTSRLKAPARIGDHILVDWKGAGLPLPTLARARVTTIHTARVRRRLGALTPDDLQAVEQGLRAALAL